MCHGGYSFKYDGCGPVWKITDDGKHIIFYGKYDVCPSSTQWCRDHCYLKTKPTNKKINPTYTLNSFDILYLDKFNNSELKDDLKTAKYVTMFASGELQHNFGIPAERCIVSLCKSLYDKKIMFFTRSEFNFTKFNLYKPDNAIIVLSVDKETPLSLINWGLDSDLVSSISIINHEDNYRLIKMVKSILPHTMECSSCTDFDCFGSKKGIILCEYQHRKL